MTLPASDGRRRLYNQGLNDYDIADKLGIRFEAIRSWRHRQGLKNNYRIPQTHHAPAFYNKERNYKTTSDERLVVGDLLIRLTRAQDKAEDILGRPLNRVERERLVKEGMEGG